MKFGIDSHAQSKPAKVGIPAKREASKAEKTTLLEEVSQSNI